MSPPSGSSGRINPPRPVLEVVGDMKLSDEGRSLLQPSMTGVEFFDVLVKARQFPDAVRLMARAMTPKQVVWWGALCVWSAGRPQPTPKAESAIRAAVKWLREPTDQNRRAAGTIGTSVGTETPAGIIATAAFFAEGSIAPEGQPEVKADPQMSGKLVSEAILNLSRSAGHEPAGGPLVRQFLAIAVEVFRGTNRPEGKS